MANGLGRSTGLVALGAVLFFLALLGFPRLISLFRDRSSNLTGGSTGWSIGADPWRLATRTNPQSFKRGDVVYACLAGKDRFPDKLWVHPSQQIIYIQSPGEKPFQIDIKDAEFVGGVVSDVIQGGQCEFTVLIKKNKGTSSVYELHVYREFVPPPEMPENPPAFELATTAPIELDTDDEPTSIDPADLDDDKDLDVTGLFVHLQRAGTPRTPMIESVVLSREKNANDHVKATATKSQQLDRKPDAPRETKPGGTITFLSTTPEK